MLIRSSSSATESVALVFTVYGSAPLDREAGRRSSAGSTSRKSAGIRSTTLGLGSVPDILTIISVVEMCRAMSRLNRQVRQLSPLQPLRQRRHRFEQIQLGDEVVALNRRRLVDGGLLLRRSWRQ